MSRGEGRSEMARGGAADRWSRVAGGGTADERANLAKLAELVSGVRVAMLHTASREGWPTHARPMYTQKVDPATFDGDLWFMTDTGSPKVAEIEADPRVTLTYADAGANRYVVVHGRASCVRDEAKAAELWNVHAKGWYPGGPSSPELRLIRVAVESGEYWDGPSSVSYMLSLTRAVISGEGIKIGGEHGHVDAGPTLWKADGAGDGVSDVATGGTPSGASEGTRAGGAGTRPSEGVRGGATKGADQDWSIGTE